MRIGVLTGGGDCPGLNAVIRGVVARAERLGPQAVSILHGWDGLLENKTRELSRNDVRGILQREGVAARVGAAGLQERDRGGAGLVVALDRRRLAVAGDAVVLDGADDGARVVAHLARDAEGGSQRDSLLPGADLHGRSLTGDA